MSRLEKIIGQKVFSRTRGGVKLTRHGEMLVPYANRALELNEEALARLREESASGQVRLGVSEDTALAGLTPALKLFRSLHPDIALEILVTEPAKLDLLLASGELDFAIGNREFNHGNPVMQWRTRPAWFASTELSIDAFPDPSARTMAKFQVPWHHGILDALRRTGWEWRVVFESASLDASPGSGRIRPGRGGAASRNGSKQQALAEIKQMRLPILPEVQFGLFRSNAAPSRAQARMESGLAASLQATTASRISSRELHEAATGLQ